MEIVKENAPHLRRRDNLSIMMLDVIIALLPTIIFTFVVFKLSALRNILISAATMILCEIVFVLIKSKPAYDGKKHEAKELFENFKKNFSINNILVPLVSALIFALIMPAETDPTYMIYPVLIIGSIFGMVVGKLIFGGTGKNIFNPAAVGMCFVKLCFGSTFRCPENNYYPSYTAGATGTEVTTGSTALPYINFAEGTFDLSHYSLFDLFLGKVPGLIGEICKVTILVGLVYLIIRHAIDWVIPLTILGIFFLDMLLVGLISYCGTVEGMTQNPFSFAAYELLSGGLIFGATFMATDPVTAPITRPAKVMYAALLGATTAIIRLFAALPEGVVYAILIANVFTSVFDYYKWSKEEFNWKNITAIASLILVPMLIIVWATCVRVF